MFDTLYRVDIRTGAITMNNAFMEGWSSEWGLQFWADKDEYFWSFINDYGFLPPRKEVIEIMTSVIKYYESLSDEEILEKNDWAAAQQYCEGSMGINLRDKYPTYDAFKVSKDYPIFLRATGQAPEPIEALETTKIQINPGFIYLIKASTGQYKIGRTRHLDKRLNLFTVKLPFKIELIHSFPAANYIEAEKGLHEYYQQFRLEGEWFDLLPEQIEEIKQIKEM